MQNIAAPDRLRLLMWVKCQSVGTPSSAEYWHIGDTTTRFFSVRPRSLIGENRALMRGVPEMEGGSWRECSERRADCQPRGRHGGSRRDALRTSLLVIASAAKQSRLPPRND